jgi:hypothetical protein
MSTHRAVFAEGLGSMPLAAALLANTLATAHSSVRVRAGNVESAASASSEKSMVANDHLSMHSIH